jgi:hypothetical protein
MSVEKKSGFVEVFKKVGIFLGVVVGVIVVMALVGVVALSGGPNLGGIIGVLALGIGIASIVHHTNKNKKKKGKK